MAIRERAGKFQVYWNNPFTRKRESCTVETRHEAEKKDALIKYQLEFERELFRREEEKEEGERPARPSPSLCTIEEVHYQYLQEKQFTLKSLRWQLGSMRQAYEAFQDTDISEITTEQLERYKKSLIQTGVKPVTVRGKLSVLRTVLNWAYKKGMLQALPRFPELPPANYEHFVPPSQSELARLLEAAPSHIRRIIILGTQLGGRVGPCELFRLKWEDVDMERQIVRMPSANKNQREPWREIPIRASLRPMLEGWMHEDAGTPYVIHWQGEPVRSIKRAWTATLRRAGITRQIRPYDLRHYFATEAIAAGVDLGTVANLMGHTGTDMLIIHYQHVLTRQKKAAVEALPDVPTCAKAYVPKN